ncbi:MAG: glycosyltransferase family 39 protein [Acidobacteria bacterium]|nr:glycosyltransferase family 39 protein [Acidobacteriota bacterium]MCA1648734.1 glycosyltransferase family 39 protein [Acidobacteriota bacterium]
MEAPVMRVNDGSRNFATRLALVAVVALLLRSVFPAADPPWNPSVGIVWHDEGAWVHNARNKTLFGAWSQDEWNPMYVAPVFTALEYLSFATLGVGVRQARLVSEIAGFVSILLLASGVRRLAGRDAALIAGALAATNYAYVMYSRAALMEATMVAFMVASWWCYVKAQDRAVWGWVAGACALLAFFTKASSAFFVGALALEAAVTLLRPTPADSPSSRKAALATLGGLVAGSAVAVATFVAPNWADYRFYNWQMSVTRKPSYALRSLIDRLTWFPILHDIFTRMWLVLVAAMAAVLGAFGRWPSTAPGERLLILWVVLGAMELILHDVGNERRFVIFIPALVALASVVLARDRRLMPPALTSVSRRRALIAAPVVAFGFYLVMGALVRVAFLYEVRPGVRIAAVLALACTAVVHSTWPLIPRWLSARQWSPAAGLLVAALVVAGDLAQFAQWAAGRTYKNIEASRELGRRLPPGTTVHGKLANGLSLENAIRPIFVGPGFGNYEDRKHRDDVRYILTYVAPRTGYEGSVIQDVLDAYPGRTIIMTFDVAETTGGHDRAALIDKFGGREREEAGRPRSAQD